MEIVVKVENASSMIARSLLNTVELVGGKSQEWKIADQERMGDAVRLAKELLDELESD